MFLLDPVTISIFRIFSTYNFEQNNLFEVHIVTLIVMGPECLVIIKTFKIIGQILTGQ